MPDIGPYLPATPSGVLAPPAARMTQGGSVVTGADPLETVKTWFRESEDALYAARRESERDRDFVDHKQWTPEEVQALRKRKQAAIVFNRMRPKVDILCGIEQKLRMDPKAYPRTPKHVEEADLATDAIRYVCDNNRFERIASQSFEWAQVVEGAAAVEVGLDWKRGRNEPEIKLWFYPFDRIGWDPHSRQPDFSDARYFHTITWMDGVQAQRVWPHAAEFISATIAAAPMTSRDTYEDTPRYWADRTRNRVQVIQMNWREGDEWVVGTFVHGGFLEPARVSPFMDEYGNSTPTLILSSGYVSREGERYGAARTWIGPQEDLNKRRSKALHLMSVRQTYSDPGVIKDKRIMKSELAKPDGHVEKNEPGEFGILGTNDMAAAHVELMREAKMEIDQTGPTAASAVPADLTGMSGVALQTHQSASMLEVQPLLDHHKDWKLRVYTAIWYRIRQFWSAPRWIRVTDSPESQKWVQMNERITRGELQAREIAAQIAEEEDVPVEQVLDSVRRTPSIYADPRAQEVVEVKHDPARLDVDIILDEGPDVVTTAQQEFDLLLALYNTGATAPMGQQIPLAELIKAAPLRGKQQLLDAIEGTDQDKAAAAQAAQNQQATQERAANAQITRTEADAALKAAQARQTLAETPAEIEKTEAQADKATAEAARIVRESGTALP